MGKAFFTLEALYALAIFIIFLSVPIITQYHDKTLLTKLHSLQQINDIIIRFDEKATILSIVDQNIPTATKMQQIANEFRGALPGTLEFRLELKSFSTKEKIACRQDKNFSSCLAQEISAVHGPPLPSSKDIVRRRMVFAKKRPNDTCSLASFAKPLQQETKKPVFLLQKKPRTIYFQGSETDSNITFNVDINGTNFSCDDHIRVDLNSVIGGQRPPIDLVMVMDRSGSMSWSGRAASSTTNALWLDGNYLFHTEASRMRDINVINPLLPGIANTFDPGTPVDVYGDGNFLYVIETAGTDELVVYDIRLPASPIERGRIAVSDPAGVFALKKYVFIAVDAAETSNDLLQIVDAKDENNLFLRGSISLSNAQDVFVDKNTAFVARGSTGVSAVNVSDVNNLSLLSTVSVGGTAEGVFADKNFVYAAMGSSGVASVNATIQTSLILLNTFNTPGNSRNLYADANKLFVADETSIMVLNISNPASMTHDRNFASPYDYDDVFKRDIYAYLASSLGLITVDIIDGPRINNAKVAANSFIDFNGWKTPPDKLGLVSFSSTASLDQQLTTDKNLVKNGVNSMVASGSTNIEQGIRTATTELQSARANPNALKFQVVMTDGQQTDGNALAAAIEARDNNIAIYTVGFGEDADATLLQQIAQLTDGNYYHASDKNALSDVFQVIAKEIGLIAQEKSGSTITNVTIKVPLGAGAVVLDKGDNDGNSTETIITENDKNFVKYAVIPKISNIKVWKGHYVMTVPCNSPNTCDSNTLSIPDSNTRFSYKNWLGTDKNTDLNTRVRVSFKYRDLTVKVPVSIISGYDLFLDINAINSGFLSTPSTLVSTCNADAAWNCVGPSVKDLNVPGFSCGQKEPGCSLFNAFYNDEEFQNIFSSQTAQIRVKVEINKNMAIRECPGNNVVKLNCGTTGNPEYYVLDFYTWLK